MYVCANCGVEFDGKVCPNCCTMRPSAAVIAGSGSILKKRTNIGVAPGQHAAQFARDVEYSRELDARRQAREEHNLKMRRRAAELAAAQERQLAKAQSMQEYPTEPPVQTVQQEAEIDPSAESYTRHLQKAVGWKRKAPVVRSQDYESEEQDVSVPDALRSLKIASAQPAKSKENSVAGKRAQKKKTDAGKDQKRMPPSIPSPGSNVSLPKGSEWSKTPNAQKIDDAWRLFARDRAAENAEKNEDSLGNKDE